MERMLLFVENCLGENLLMDIKCEDISHTKKDESVHN